MQKKDGFTVTPSQHQSKPHNPRNKDKKNIKLRDVASYEHGKMMMVLFESIDVKLMSSWMKYGLHTHVLVFSEQIPCPHCLSFVVSNSHGAGATVVFLAKVFIWKLLAPYASVHV
jgi:hypothetical protein